MERLTKEQLRAEEDFFESKGLTICDGCKNGDEVCRHCRHNYDSLYEEKELLKLIRGGIENETDGR